MNHTWIWNGHTYLFNVCESEQIDRIWNALRNLGKELDDITDIKQSAPGDTLRKICVVIRRFFDKVFGDGSGAKICGETHDINEHVTAYMEFILFFNEQTEENRAKMAVFEEKIHEAVNESEE